METIVIQSQSKENLRIFKELATKLGENAISIDAEHLEDIAFGLLMKKAKTGKKVGRGTIMKKLRAA